MAYACVDFIYGLDLTIDGDEHDELLMEALEMGNAGFSMPYSGEPGYAPARFGLCLQSADVSTTAIDGEALQITDAVRARYAELLAKLSPELQDMLKPFGEPKLFLLWSSS